MRTIEETAAAILAPPKGMLVADEYAEALVPSAADLALREPALTDHVSALLLTAETFAATLPLRRELSESPAELLAGVRMAPTGTGVRDRLVEAARDGASFVEWRAHLSPLDVPHGATHIEADKLASVAAATQAEGLLPVLTIAMPDLGSSSITVNQATTTNALLALRDQLQRTGVDPRQLLIRLNMVVAGLSHPSPAAPDQVALQTLQLLEWALPSGTPGVLLLSGGQSLDQACANLSAVSALAAKQGVPWRVTFGFSRALVAAASGAPGDDDAAARKLLVQSARLASESTATARVPEKAGS
jgi:fructose-bisphosphate aldolase class 1